MKKERFRILTWKHCAIRILLPLISIFCFSICFASDSGDVLFVQITDVHISGNPKNSIRNAILEKTVKICNEIIKPDFVVSTGDVSEFGKVDEWEVYKKIISKLKCKTCIVPGNHDGYEALLQKWPDYFGDVHFSFSLNGVHFIGMNSAKNSKDYPNNIKGTVTTAEFEWLQNELKQIKKDTPVCMFSHHLPQGGNIEQNKDAVLALIKNYNVLLWASGHYHYFYNLNADKTTFIVSESLCKSRKNPKTQEQSLSGLRIYFIHNGIFSTRFVELAKSRLSDDPGPYAMIINPASDLWGDKKSAAADKLIEALVFHDIDIKNVECYVNDQFIGNMRAEKNGIWRIEIPEGFTSGERRVKVVAIDKNGQRDINEITATRK